MFVRNHLEDREAQCLKPYAMQARHSKGRVYTEKEHAFRTAFQRDHDRIVHSVAFRRLEYKTQVFLNDMGDHYRTRLTHSLEVAGLARTTARALGLNDDLVETVALAHDLGHTPFGHAGERVLNRLMKDYGGFEHNNQTLRILTFLEKRSPEFNGLNLTYETRESLIKHSPYAKVGEEYAPQLSPLLESYVVDICDEIAYDNHDLDDGLRSGLITEDLLVKISLWQIASDVVQKRFGELDKKLRRSRIISTLIGLMMDDFLQTSDAKITQLGLKSLEDVRLCKEIPICFSLDMQKRKKELEQFLQESLYRNYRVNRMMFKAELCIENLFRYFSSHLEALPNEFQNIANKEGLHRAVSDYIAGMTDRYAYQVYDELFLAKSR